MLTVCIDTNVWISGIIFSGIPAKIVDFAFNKKFTVIASQCILEELELNLLKKFHFSYKNVRKFIYRILQISDLYKPQGTIKIIKNHVMDNLVLETAILGRAKYLITGDHQHLLPIQFYKNVKIVKPAS